MNCSSLANTTPTNNSRLDFFNRMMESLTNGRDSAIKLRSRLSGGGGGGGGESSNNYEAAELADQILASFSHGISFLQVANEFNELDRSKDMVINNGGGINSGLIKSEEDYGESPKNVAKDGRGRHRRRKTCESWETITETLIDDGHAWRKYGNKNIIGTNHPRSYYKCTHKDDQGCQAKKHVQMVSDKPERYMTIYIGEHTCTDNPLQTTQPSLLIDCLDEEMMCFETKSGPATPAATNYYNIEKAPPQNTPTTSSTPSAALSFSSAEFCFHTGNKGTSSSNASTMMKKQQHNSSHHSNMIIQAEDHIMMMMNNMSNHNLMNADMEHMYHSPSDNCNVSSIDHPLANMNNSTGPDHSAAGSDNGDVVSVGNCPAAGPSSCLDSLECFDIDAYMIDNLDDVLGFTFS